MALVGHPPESNISWSSMDFWINTRTQNSSLHMSTFCNMRNTKPSNSYEEYSSALLPQEINDCVFIYFKCRWIKDYTLASHCIKKIFNCAFVLKGWQTSGGFLPFVLCTCLYNVYKVHLFSSSMGLYSSRKSLGGMIICNKTAQSSSTNEGKLGYYSLYSHCLANIFFQISVQFPLEQAAHGWVRVFFSER